MRRAALVIGVLLAALVPAAAAVSHIPPVARAVLVAYVSALQHERYADAFALLTPAERTYFRSAKNFASIFKADELQIHSFKVIGSRNAGALGVLGLVSENIAFLDQAHQAAGTASVTVPYGLISIGSSYRIKDPFHPWYAFRPTGVTASAQGLHMTVRKISLFSGRIEVVVTFENLGDAFVTLLPYGRSVLRSDNGSVFHPIATRSDALTDRQLYLGLRLAPNAEYTGAISFTVPTSRTPKSLSLTVAPSLRDGGDAPFSIDLPSIVVST